MSLFLKTCAQLKSYHSLYEATKSPQAIYYMLEGFSARKSSCYINSQGIGYLGTKLYQIHGQLDRIFLHENFIDCDNLINVFNKVE